MSKNILVIGGTRYIGKLLVQRLLRAGHRVTIATRGYAPDPFGARIERVRVDRRNEPAMRAAFAGRSWDIVFDQMCYSPLDAAISVRTFGGRVGRYVMTSTIDVYRSLGHAHSRPLTENDLAVHAQTIDASYPWHDPARAIESYVTGKLQAEAYLVRDGGLPLAVARLAHVLGGPEDFTGRLAHYVELARVHGVLPYTNEHAAQNFMTAPAAAAFLDWTGMQSFEGAVNAGSDGPLSAAQLYRRVGQVLDTQVTLQRVATPAPDATPLSPFDLPGPMVLDTTRARSLGWRFDHTDEWLDDTIRQHDLAFV
jgi:nucleoside-diphosphate-sugar epimerase